MKKLGLVFIAVLGLAGCVAVPVAEPAYVGATVVVRPYGYYGPRHHYYGPRHHHHHGGYYRGG